MAYTKQNFEDGKVLSAAQLNLMDDAIAALTVSGLGKVDNLQTVTDLYNLPGNGVFFYSGAAFDDFYTGLGGNSGWGIVLNMDDPNYGYGKQKIYLFNNGGTLTCVRSRDMGGWGEWEWENPPLLNGVEYRTTERYNGNPVYIKKLDMGYLADNWYTSVNHGVTDSQIIDMKIMRIHAYQNISVQLPSFHSGTGDLEACAYASDGLLVVRTFCAQNGEWKAEAVIKYYK
jgi:hypothetical protein